MAEPKTKKTTASVSAFLNTIADEEARKDCKAISTMMEKAARSKPAMWGTGIVGFGSVKMKYASGRELDWPVTAFAPRKGNITLYILGAYDERDALLKTLGKYQAEWGLSTHQAAVGRPLADADEADRRFDQARQEELFSLSNRAQLVDPLADRRCEPGGFISGCAAGAQCA